MYPGLLWEKLYFLTEFESHEMLGGSNITIFFFNISISHCDLLDMVKC